MERGFSAASTPQAGDPAGGPLRIAVLAHIRHPIAPPFQGGMEAHSWHLVRALEARGHAVTLFASGDSDPSLPLRGVVPVHYDRAFPWHAFHGTDILNLHVDTAFAAAMDALPRGGFDVVHNNTLHRYPPRLARRDRIAMVTSLHVPPFTILHRAVQESAAPWSHFTVTSERQRGAWWPEGAPNEAHVVHNGIDPELWPYRGNAARGGAIWSGRITPNKGTHLAVQAAMIAKVPLDIYGTIEHRDYYDAEVAPHLGEDIRYMGHAEARTLADALGRAAVMLFTPRWDEPFGLAAIEALACGTPVAAVEMGAVREVIGPAGCYAAPDDPHSLAAALREAIRIPRAQARARAVSCFSIDRMIDGYERLYRAAIAGAAHGPAMPDPQFAPRQLGVGSPAEPAPPEAPAISVAPSEAHRRGVSSRH
ncbi:glycosyltransferase [Profundibacterium mesophilum]|uniref:Glycoprotein 3-alpha-L-fucosyltransferase n=1 Tax=Profundibacterium mesophilum KAUST100406-0324 TaxID=1037889 RepID=A0A921NYV0_9RHOB|nr:glycosyltransferase [Profundibacterium mesophilum]KAF0676013.1 glycoprotein 3-alpha-L-fucosyltransferase [Profundibacterium mesophilum KAUST100406-0324]